MPKPALALALLALLAAPRADAANAVVRFTTVLGDFDVELCTEVSAACPGVAPSTVANFLRYVDENRYPETMFIHRRGAGPPSPSPLVIQGGGYWLDASVPRVEDVCPPDACDPIDLELGASLSNVRGTIAMARGVALNSATSQWFINLVDNVSLDTAGGGYAVFGKVVSGLDVMDAIGALEIWAIQGSAIFTELPLLDTYPGSGSVINYLVYVSDISRVPEPDAAAGAAATALALVALARRRA